MAGQRQPSLPPHPILCHSFHFFFFSLLCFIPHLVARPMSIWTGQCNCLETRFCHLHVASSHFASFSGLTLLYLPARNEIIRGVDEKLTSLLHLPVALSDGCHSNHYATEQTQWVKDGFECGSLRSQPGYDRTDRPTRAAVHSLHKVNSSIHCVSGSYRFQVQAHLTEVTSPLLLFFIR